MELKKAIKEFKNKQVLVIGDVILDQYTYGEVLRISPEAPVPVLKKTKESYVVGGAANVANNIASLGASVSLCGIIGNDHNGTILKKLLRQKKINSRLLFENSAVSTIVKHRLVAGNSHQILRVDEERDYNQFPKRIEQEILSKLLVSLQTVDAIVISDYAKGFFFKSLTKKIIDLAKNNKIPLFADIKPTNKALFKGVTLVKPNEKEAIEMSGVEDVHKAGRRLVKYFNADIVITCGNKGIYAFDKSGTEYHVPARVVEVFDVSGAGDTIISVLALSRISGLAIEDSITLSNNAGSLVVQKAGTAYVTRNELLSLIEPVNHIESVYTVPKLWGYEKWIENNEKYCSKLLSLKKGYQCSLHYHKIKDEMFILTKGHVRLEVDQKVVHLKPGMFQRIPPGTKHRFRGIEDSLIIEVSTKHMDDDSYRIEESKKV